jgi:hypothetical protein
VTHPAELAEAALTPEETERILQACGSRAILVGGQALAVWAAHYGIVPTAELSLAVTTDADFIGTGQAARELQASLGQPWQVRVATLDDHGGQVAKVYARIAGVGIKQVDFLAGVVGLETRDVVQRVAVLQAAPGIEIQILHPLDVLESRLRNLDVLPHKRNAIGRAQALLAVSIVRAFIEQFMDEGGPARVVNQAVQRVARMALDSRLSQVGFEWDIDVLAAVPIERISHPRLREEQWPRIQARLARKREKFNALQLRRAALRARRKPQT